MKSYKLALTGIALAIGFLASAQAQGRNTASGTFNGIDWHAQSMLTGFSGTGTASTAGDAVYLPSYPANSGVVGLLMNYGAAGSFICSGTLMADRQSILTAGHCVSDGFGTAGPLTTTVFFQPAAGLPVTQSIYGNPAATAITVSNYFVNPGYTGQVIDQNDVAVLRMSSEAPAWAVSHGIYTGGDLTGQDFTVAGYGRLGTGAGTNTATGRLRTGDNRYDFRFGDPDFGAGYWDGAFDNPALPSAQLAYSYVSDFDNGLAANDASCLLAADPDFGLSGPKWCNTGRGVREVGVAGGDSGGPNFIGGLVSGVNSYGLSFGTAYGDINSGLNSSFGEFSGYVPTFIHADFINASLVPEPSTYLMLALGLAGVGFAARRRAAN
ncbi:MAG: trypsin-like serine protease [Rubrivivax sp.]|nr:trypsin-like serine protease [Rubrivivax sp.]MDP3226298.1 trypsin-like serine protease [Rubrivivax sp.]